MVSKLKEGKERKKITDKGLLRLNWQRVFPTDIRFVAISFVILGVIRFMGLARYGVNFVVFGFLLMWVMPIVFLNKEGRRRIGIQKPQSWLYINLGEC